MSRIVTWSPEARFDIRSILSYIGEDNPRAALRIYERIDEMISRLAEMPFGRKGRMGGTHEMVVTGLPYIICYRVGASEFEVARIIHGARNWPQGEWPE